METVGLLRRKQPTNEVLSEDIQEGATNSTRQRTGQRPTEIFPKEGIQILDEPKDSTPTLAKPYPGIRDIVKQTYITKNITEEPIQVIINSWSSSTLKQYDSALEKWWNFAKTNAVNIYKPKTADIIQFLHSSLIEGKKYGTLNTYRSAINMIIEDPIGERTVNRYLKGVFKENPTYPKYNSTWDPSPVLQHLSQLHPLNSLTLKDLTLKMTVLLALCTGHRIHTISTIKIENVKIRKEYIEILLTEPLKTSKPGKSQPILSIPFFHEERLCLAKTIIKYIETTEVIRKQYNQMIIAPKKSHHPASTQTISRWIKTVLNKVGIDTQKNSGYSFRHSSVSTAYRNGTNIETIRSTVGRLVPKFRHLF